MAASDFTRTAPAPGLTYEHLLWGEVIVGSKAELQYLGLGKGLSFPGEPGGPQRRLTVRDPRGFVANIEGLRYCGSRGCEVFHAIIKFPGRDLPLLPDWKPYAPGVKMREYIWHDEYRGTADALSAAGLVPSGCFPGQPGMRKQCVTIYADGTVANGKPNANDHRRNEPAARQVAVSGKSAFLVSVNLSEEDGETRFHAVQVELGERVARMKALPRPRPLNESLGLCLVASSRQPSVDVHPTLPPSREKTSLDAVRQRFSLFSSLCSRAAEEIRAKQAKRPDDLNHSAKLWRAIDDLSLARQVISDVIRELERLTGWDSKRD